MSGNTPVKEPTVIDVETVLEAINVALGLVGIASDDHEITYEPRLFPGHYLKESCLKVTIKIKQSAYRPINRKGRLRLVAAVDKALEPWRQQRYCTIIHRGVEIARINSWPHPISPSFEIVNDEPGRPTEVRPVDTFPEVTTHPTSPLDIVFGLHAVQSPGEFGRAYTRFRPEAVLCALLLDPVWKKSDDPIWPISDSPLLPIQDGDIEGVIERAWKFSYRARPEKRIRAIAWATALEFMYVLDNFETVSSSCQNWQDENAKHTPVDGIGVVVSIPVGGPEWPNESKVRAQFAKIAVRAIEELSRIEGTSAALSWDALSINTVKHLHAMSLGFLASDNRLGEPSVFLEASKRGKELLETVRWPV